jgi:hypothetical protein
MTQPTNNGQASFLGHLASNLTSLGMRPLVLTGFFRDYLIRCFNEPDQIEEPDLRAFLWSTEEAATILIADAYDYDPNRTERRPAVLIKRNAYQNARLSVGDFAGFDARTMDQKFSTIWVGSHTIFCIYGTGAGVELLATEVQRRLTKFTRAITTELNLQKYQVMQVGEISVLEEAQQNFCVPITVGIAYDENWELRYEAPVLRRIGLKALFGLK